jgi:2-polyprenyl-3-methyl-5-hydroxy-6-metoxy-1,4-benzoquinol methylase
MDDFELSGPELAVLLNDLERVNRFLGGNKCTISGLSRLCPESDKQMVILDLGCGDGAQLRHCVKWAKKQGRIIRGIGLDANAHIIGEARKRSRDYPELEFRIFDVFSKQETLPEFDIGLCTLFLHHFQNESIISLLDRLISSARIGIIVNDLQRHRAAFLAFRLLIAPLLRSPIARHDGAVSVARSFTKSEMDDLASKIHAEHRLDWCWAFRWRWILKPVNPS